MLLIVRVAFFLFFLALVELLKMGLPSTEEHSFWLALFMMMICEIGDLGDKLRDLHKKYIKE